MNQIELSIKNKEKIVRIMQSIGNKFSSDVRFEWSNVGNNLVAYIVKEQLTGRPGLKRVSGNASRALNVTTKKIGNDVIQRFFLNKSNPAKTYLPMHDISRKDNGVIRPRNKKYLVFKVGDQWVSAKSVKIPARVNINETLKKLGDIRRTKAVRKVLRRYSNGFTS